MRSSFLNRVWISGSTHARLANATPLQPSLNMLVNSTNVASSVAYGAASAYTSVSSGSQHVQIEATSNNNIVFDQSLSLNSGNNTVLVTNSGAVVLADNRTTPPSGQVSIRAINASDLLGPADVYIVTSSTNILGVSPTASSVAFASATTYQTVNAGTYVVIFTPPNQKTPIVSSSPLTLSGGQVRSVMALDGANGAGGFTSSVLADLN